MSFELSMLEARCLEGILVEWSVGRTQAELLRIPGRRQVRIYVNKTNTINLALFANI